MQQMDQSSVMLWSSKSIKIPHMRKDCVGFAFAEEIYYDSS